MTKRSRGGLRARGGIGRGPSLGLLLVLLALLPLGGPGGCSQARPTVSVEVTTYVRPQAPPTLSGHAIAVVALPDQETSLEHAHARDQVAAELRARGARVVETRAGAEFLVSLAYTLDDGETRIDLAPAGSAWDPMPFGPVRPRYPGMVRPALIERTIQTATLTLAVYDARAAGDTPLAQVTPVAQMHARVQGQHLTLPQALDPLIRGALQAYPGQDGAVRRVPVALF
ncbi:DUF4136 domain-containing protein [Pararhodospirillum oryzae]|uniref:DUF4136 domain-containing protein n=1 Tax=Pararhodospirillum oryzae TaxID=478448 RepID=A0A512HAI1_9PROT|nr:hypothetical protein [Pararhodospirillum oryzae]GEO82463.1 hypothetical protein ROR02_25940 [Pararhodospirillum oryzae]